MVADYGMEPLRVRRFLLIFILEALVGMIRIDGHVYRFMGPKDIGVNDVLPQKTVQVYPTQTVYTFGNSMIDLTVTFSTPTIPTDLEKLSYPVTFITFKVHTKDQTKHNIQIYYDNTGEILLCVPLHSSQVNLS